MVQKTVNAKTKAGLRSSTMVWDSDARCPKGHRPSHNTFSKVQTQGSKDLFCPKKTKSKDLKSVPLCDDAAELPKKDNKKDKKKKFQDQKREYTGKRKEQTLATIVNTTDVSKEKKKKRAICEITYFNCNKKGHFANDCTKPKN